MPIVSTHFPPSPIWYHSSTLIHILFLFSSPLPGCLPKFFTVLSLSILTNFNYSYNTWTLDNFSFLVTIFKHRTIYFLKIFISLITEALSTLFVRIQDKALQVTIGLICLSHIQTAAPAHNNHHCNTHCNILAVKIQSSLAVLTALCTLSVWHGSVIVLLTLVHCTVRCECTLRDYKHNISFIQAVLWF
jgi:hypothetical protein